MTDAGTNWIDFYISLTPVAQTGIWAGVAVAALLTFRKPLRQLAEELARRVNQGDDVSTPWLSLERREEREREIVEQVTDNIRSEIRSSSKNDENRLSGIEDADIEVLLEKVSNRFVDLIFPASDFWTKTGQDAKTSLYVTDWVTVSDFLNEAYGAARQVGVQIPAWSYGRLWRLKNQRTDEYITKLKLGQKKDKRPFEDLGINPNDVLIAERII